MARRHTEGEFNLEVDIGDRRASIGDDQAPVAIGLSSGAEGYGNGAEAPMTTESRIEPNVTLGELLMLHELSILAYEDQARDPRSKLAELRDISSDTISSSMTNIEQALGKIEDREIEGQVSILTPTARNIGEAAYLADYLIMLAKRQDVDQEKLRILIGDFVVSAEGQGDGGKLAHDR